ncbi:MAG: hypothetical protein GQ570_12985 [Helicobacteraceae bacterium]|nr:hypothetical protein [Helicobacteraceae bacterium]
MSNYKIKTDMSKLTSTSVTTFAHDVLKHMKNNDHFKKPTPSLKELEDATLSYKQASSDAIEGTKEQTDIKNQKKKELTNVLSKLAQFVNFSADGDKTALDSSGFTLAESKSSIGILDAPSSVHVKDGSNHGELEVSYSKVAKAKSYKIIYTIDQTQEESKWLSKQSNSTTLLVTGLEKAKEYFFKVAAVSSEAIKNDHFNYTDVVSRISQ